MKKLILLLLPFCAINTTFSQQFWGSLGNGTTSSVKCMVEDTAINCLYVGGTFIEVDTLQNVFCIAKWNGTNWQRVGSGMNHYVLSFTMYNNELYAGGVFTTAGGVNANHIAKWNGTTWDSLGSGVNGPVWCIKVIDNELYVGGTFDSAGNISANSLAKWDGTQWSQIDSFPKFDQFNDNWVRSIAKYNNTLYVGGIFYNDDINNDIRGITMFDGSDWVKVGDGLKGEVGISEMLIYKNELVIGGYFSKASGNIGQNIQSWDGSQFKEVGGGISDMGIVPMLIHENELYVGGGFFYAGNIPANKLAKWDGSRWCSLAGVFDNNISAIGFFRDTLYVGCGLTIDGFTVNRIAKWLGGDYVDTCSQPYSVPEISDYTGIAIFPNPAHSQITIISNNGEPIKHAEIYSLTGKMVLRKELNPANAEIDVSGLAEGLYVVKVQTASEVLYKKIIIQK